MRPSHLLLVCLLPVAWACASGGAPEPAAVASDADWEVLLGPRPTPLAGAPRIAVGSLSLGDERWGLGASVPAQVAIQELVSVGLLRRADIQFVERRRFAEAAERERRGLPRPPGAPPVGISPGVELLLTGALSPFPGDSAWLDLRLVEPMTGAFRSAWRVGVPRDADPTTLARRIIGSLVATLDSLDGLPAWNDPVPAAAPRTWRDTSISPAAADAFARGVAAEDAYDWEAARRAYQRAQQLGGEAFFEPDVALARVARLRAGGTLGES